MPLSKEQREKLAREYVERYYPAARREDVQRVMDMAVQGFKGGYSPSPNEWDEGGGIGTGQTFREYVIDRGELVTNLIKNFFLTYRISQI